VNHRQRATGPCECGAGDTHAVHIFDVCRRAHTFDFVGQGWKSLLQGCQAEQVITIQRFVHADSWS
jgi:hypothetical protein